MSTSIGPGTRRPLRVIAGKYRRRKLKSLPGHTTRPMLDRLRQTLFDVLQNEVPGKRFVDLYAGTGAVGIEALSRGASQATFVEASPSASALIEENLHSLGAEGDALVVRRAVAVALERVEGDIYFLGPPYQATEEYEQTLAALGEHPPGLVIAQHARRDPLAESYGRLRKARVIEQGKNALTLFRPEEGSPEEEPD